MITKPLKLGIFAKTHCQKTVLLIKSWILENDLISAVD